MEPKIIQLVENEFYKGDCSEPMLYEVTGKGTWEEFRKSYYEARKEWYDQEETAMSELEYIGAKIIEKGFAMKSITLEKMNF